ncbi:MAG: MAPEG family protein [Paraglaciecola sp.]|uniref:MAPEG family protein n=1 Tax=Paraglaciecola sp. TaxID=1920173 RepID=UPI00273DE1F8|nr:MAPEG family protein [Paraglaciecola sp.]MDP5030475.1 MAPEG family protein [Paraglaciecola sp.]MDP5131975.1 MAPEG family protein [Paraglaciecola sp.]
MPYVDLVAILAVLQFFFFALMTGRARMVTGVKAPATSGHEDFDRMYRVQMNTLELLVMFLPALLLAGKYFSGLTWLVAALGSMYIIGRFVYWRAYVGDPAKRGLGFGLSMLPILVLILMALVGIILSLLS